MLKSIIIQGGDHLGGIDRFWFAEADSVIFSEPNESGVLTDPVSFTGTSWLEIQLQKGSGGFTAPMSHTKHGEIYTHAMAGIVPEVSEEVAADLSLMKKYRYILCVKDNDGNYWLAGTPEQPLTFSYKKDSLRAPGELANHSIEFGGKVYHKPISYQPEEKYLPDFETEAVIENLTAINVQGGVQLDWTLTPASEPGILEIYRKMDGGNYQKVGEAADFATTFTDTTIADNTHYTYVVSWLAAVGLNSNEADVTTLDADLSASFLGDTVTVTFGAASTQEILYKIGAGEAQSFNTGAAEVITGVAGKQLRFYATNAALITSVVFDDTVNPQAFGNLLIKGSFTALQIFQLKDGNLTGFAFGSWVQQAGYTLDLTNSIVSVADADKLVNALIEANGGTVTDDGAGNYTGDPGIGTSANTRSIDIGSLSVNIAVSQSQPDKLLLSKIQALGTPSIDGVGFEVTTIRTVCDSAMDFDFSAIGSTDTVSQLSNWIEQATELNLENMSVSDFLNFTFELRFDDPSTGIETKATGLQNIDTYLKGSEFQNYFNTLFDNGQYEDEVEMKRYTVVAKRAQESNDSQCRLSYLKYPTTLEGRTCGTVVDVTKVGAFALYSMTKMQSNYNGPVFQDTDLNDYDFANKPTVVVTIETLYSQTNKCDLERFNSVDQYIPEEDAILIGYGGGDPHYLSDLTGVNEDFSDITICCNVKSLGQSGTQRVVAFSWYDNDGKLNNIQILKSGQGLTGNDRYDNGTINAFSFTSSLSQSEYSLAFLTINTVTGEMKGYLNGYNEVLSTVSVVKKYVSGKSIYAGYTQNNDTLCDFIAVYPKILNQAEMEDLYNRLQN
ncbi:hypothetical protein V6R21_07690 [Limibacter armeniacum]|uniref:hypothetical protein n=1 Tax=Limibacter armeniacum TaxID=466084 RepID=UPI002FE621BF